MRRPIRLAKTVQAPEMDETSTRLRLSAFRRRFSAPWRAPNSSGRRGWARASQQGLRRIGGSRELRLLIRVLMQIARALPFFPLEDHDRRHF